MRWLLTPVMLTLVACGGPSDETLIDELRILTAIPDPPEVEPGGRVSIAPVIVDPEQSGVEVLTWLCTIAGPPGSPCLELVGPEPGDSLAAAQGGVAVDLMVSPLLSEALPGADSFLDIEVRVLACAPGLCPVIAQATSERSELSDELVDRLSDPVSLLVDLPLEGVSYARRPLRISQRAQEDRLVAPIVSAAPADESPAPESEVGVRVQVEHPREVPVTVYGFATAGGFGPASVEVVDGEAELTWFAPGQSGEVTLWVLASTEDGEEDLWSSTLTVR